MKCAVIEEKLVFYALKADYFKLLQIAQAFYLIPLYSPARVVLLQHVA